MDEILKKLVNIEKSYAEAFNQKDIDTILDYFDPDISGFSSTRHKRFNGKEELRKTFEYYMSEADDVRFEISEPEVSRFGDIGILNFYWKVLLKNGSKSQEIPGRGTHVYQKSGDSWHIVHEHFSKAH
ncbi:MAG: nuclear transport factor 2 family protein [Calditrichia bacterium]